MPKINPFKEYKKRIIVSSNGVSSKTKVDKKNRPILECGIGKSSLPKTIKENLDAGTDTNITHSHMITVGVKKYHDVLKSDGVSDKIHESAPTSTDPSDLTHLHKYTENSHDLNQLVVGLHKGDKSTVDAYKENLDAARGLDKMMDGAKTTHEFSVYTGVKHSPYKSLSEGDGIHYMPAFTSASSSFHVAATFAKQYGELDKHAHANEYPTDAEIKSNGLDKHAHIVNPKDGKHTINPLSSGHVLRIKVPAGSSAMSVRKHSPYPDEHEILLHRGGMVKVHPNPTVHKLDNGAHAVVWDADLIGRDADPLPRNLTESFDSTLPTSKNHELTGLMNQMKPMMNGDVSNISVHTTSGDNPYHIMTYDHDGAKEVHVFKDMMSHGRLGSAKSALRVFSTAMNMAKPHMDSGGKVRICAHPDLHDSYSRMIDKTYHKKDYDFTPFDDHVGADYQPKSGWIVSKKST